jgi:hypothetical protein
MKPSLWIEMFWFENEFLSSNGQQWLKLAETRSEGDNSSFTQWFSTIQISLAS